MFKKIVSILLLVVIFTTGCTTTKASQEISTAEGKILTTPVAVRVPTPPVLQQEYETLSLYYLYNPVDFQEAGIAVVPISSIALLDSPLPGPADAIGLIVYGTVVVAYVAYTATVPVGTIYYDTPDDLVATLGMFGTLAKYLPVTEEHKQAHTVIGGSSNVATQVFADLSRRWPPDPNEEDLTRKVMCYVLKCGHEVMRYLVWSGTGMSATGLPRGNLSWWQYGPNGPEVYGYSGKSLRTMENIPTDLQGKGFTIEQSSCDNFTPPFQLLAP